MADYAPLLSLVELQILASLADGKTLSAIGEEVHLSQPSISKLLRETQRKTGLPVAEHQGRRLVLTSLGLDLAHMAQALLAQHREIDHWVRGAAAGERGTIHLLATVTPSNYVLPSALARLAQQYPGIEIRLSELPSEEILRVFLDGPADLALTPIPRGDAQILEQVAVVEYVHQEPVTFFVAPGSPLAALPVVHWEDIGRYTLVGPFERTYWLEMFRQSVPGGEPAAGRRIALAGAEGVKRIVCAGNYVGVHFGMALREELAAGTLVPLTVEGLVLTQRFLLLRRRSSRPFLGATILANLLQEELARSRPSLSQPAA